VIHNLGYKEIVTVLVPIIAQHQKHHTIVTVLVLVRVSFVLVLVGNYLIKLGLI
jgi:hypothetical protein